MEKFAFILHPLDMGQITRKYRIARKIPEKLVAGAFKHKRPWAISEITGAKSPTGKEAMGWFIVVPLLPHQILNLREKYVIKKIVKGCKVASKLGAKIVGLGAFTALVGGGGRAVAKEAEIAVTTGNTYTIATAIEGTKRAAQIMDINLSKACVAVVGATGSIGSVCAQVMAPQVERLYLVGRDERKLAHVTEKVRRSLPDGRDKVTYSTQVSQSVGQADIIISVTSAIDFVIHPEDIKSGAVVCDVARPRDVAEAVAEVRDDVLVIDGGVVKPPGNVDFHLDFGLPPGLTLACMAETMILALEGRYEDYTIGKDINIEQVEEIEEMARKHGFELAGFRSFEKALTLEQIKRIKQKARSRASSRGLNSESFSQRHGR